MLDRELLALTGEKPRHEWQVHRLDDGRAFGLATYGDPSGTPVFCFHGAPASRLMFDVADEAAATLGLHLYCPDRPGYGLTPPDEGLSLADRTDEFEAILGHLGLERVALLGVSGGAPYAVALAARLGRRVTAMALVSPMGPIADLQDVAAAGSLPKGQRWFFLELPRRRAALRVLAAIAASGFRLSPERAAGLFARMLSESDTRILGKPEYEESLIRMTREALRQGTCGGLADLEIFSRPWNVDFAAVRAPSVLWQGTADRIVPVKAALWLGEQLPDCSIELIEGAGHFWIYENIHPALERLAWLVDPAG